jgi:hypothetical protein
MSPTIEQLRRLTQAKGPQFSKSHTPNGGVGACCQICLDTETAGASVSRRSGGAVWPHALHKSHGHGFFRNCDPHDIFDRVAPNRIDSVFGSQINAEVVSE